MARKTKKDHIGMNVAGLSRFNEEIAGADEGSRGAEAMWVAAGLRRDFEAAGINLPGDRRAAADKLAAGIERLRMLIGGVIFISA